MEDYIIVQELAGSRIAAECATAKSKALLMTLGFHDNGDFCVKQIENEEERIELIKAFIKIGALFSEGRDWSPAELLLYYREKGVLSEKFKSIAWSNPDTYHIVEK
jgi:hypothetical protein